MDITALTGDEAWTITAGHISKNGKFESARGIIYQAKVEADKIFYKGGNRNRGEFERIDKDDFFIAFEAIKKLPTINTNVIKGLIQAYTASRNNRAVLSSTSNASTT